jgi:hypothetical protein
VIGLGDGEDDPGITARGTVRIQDGTSNTIAFTESGGSTAKCSMDSGTGEQMLTELSLKLREPRSSEPLTLVILPVDGAAAFPGVFDADFRIDNETWRGEIRIDLFGRPASEPDRR